MSLRILSTFASLAFAATAFAHDPEFHQLQVPKLKPTTCEQYADRETYSNDLSDPDIKALKDGCDAAKTADEAPQTEEGKDAKKDD